MGLPRLSLTFSVSLLKLFTRSESFVLSICGPCPPTSLERLLPAVPSLGDPALPGALPRVRA